MLTIELMRTRRRRSTARPRMGDEDGAHVNEARGGASNAAAPGRSARPPPPRTTPTRRRPRYGFAQEICDRRAMRLLAAITLLVPATAFANPDALARRWPSLRRRRNGRVDPRTPSETGQLRSARVAAPDPVAVDDGPSPTREHDVAPPHTVGATATDTDVVAELAAHQMKRRSARVDGCLAAAHKRAPAAAGSLPLDFDVADSRSRACASPMTACTTCSSPPASRARRAASPSRSPPLASAGPSRSAAKRASPLIDTCSRSGNIMRSGNK